MKRPDRLFRGIAERQGIGAWIGWILTPAGHIYGWLVRLRRIYYDNFRVKNAVQLPCVVVSIGNLETGGTGKTPVVISLAGSIVEKGLNVAVVAKNIDRKTEPVHVRPCSRGNEKRFCDEVLLLAENLKGIASVYTADSKSEAAVKAFMDSKPDVILIDDGFQHFRLRRNIDIVVLDFETPFGTGGMLPAGTLREPPSSLSNADYIWVNRVARGMTAEWVKRRINDYNWRSPLIFSRMKVITVCKLDGTPVDEYPAEKVVAFCSIGRPKSFAQTISDTGIKICELADYPDHYEYTQKDIDNLNDLCTKTNASHLITTEKDAVKLRKFKNTENILVLHTALETQGAIPELLEYIENTATRYAGKRASKEHP